MFRLRANFHNSENVWELGPDELYDVPLLPGKCSYCLLSCYFLTRLAKSLNVMSYVMANSDRYEAVARAPINLTLMSCIESSAYAGHQGLTSDPNPNSSSGVIDEWRPPPIKR